MYFVSCSISLKNEKKDVWKAISRHGNLNFFHPFCKNNEVIEVDENSIKKDFLIYLNGMMFEREFYQWEKMKGYKLMIGKKNGKKSKVVWKISENKNYTSLSIMVFPYKSDKISSLLYPFFFFFYIKPKLKSYLKSVLNGLKFYLYNNQTVVKNQFGKHSWFS